MFTLSGFIGFVLLFAFSFILSFINSDYTSYINSFFFSNFFNLTIACIVIGLPFSLIYNQSKNAK